MSDQANLEEISDEELDSLPNAARTRLRQLEREVRDLRPLKDENDRFKLKEDLRANDMDLSNTQLKALLAAHEGETTPELLRKTAEELKFVEPKPATDPKDADAHGAIDAARSGAQGVGEKLSTYEEEVANANSMQELQEIAERHGRTVLERQV